MQHRRHAGVRLVQHTARAGPEHLRVHNLLVRCHTFLHATAAQCAPVSAYILSVKPSMVGPQKLPSLCLRASALS